MKFYKWQLKSFMNIINKTAFILFTIVSLNGFSQGWKGYEWDVFPVDRRWRQGGLTGSLGINYTLGYPGQQQKQTAQLGFFQFENDYQSVAKGKIGLNAELGWFHSFKKPFYFHFFDVMLSWKWFRTQQTAQYSQYFNNDLLDQQSFELPWNAHTLGLSINLMNQYPFSPKSFFLHGPGLNFDYPFITSGVSKPLTGLEYYGDMPVQMQLHYNVGLGFVIKDRWLLIPMLESPIFQIIPFTHIQSTLNVMYCRYRPFLLQIKIMRLRKQKNDCPPVYNPGGIDPKTYQPEKKE